MPAPKFIFLTILSFLLLPLPGQEANSLKSSVVNSSVSPYYSEYQDFYDVKFYFIDLQVSNTGTFIKGKTLVKVEMIKETDSLVFELDSRLSVDSVIINSIPANDFLSAANLLKIKIPETLISQKELSAEIFYAGVAGIQSFYGGVLTRQDHIYDKTVTYTLSEPFQSMLWFPCKQDLRDKADSAWIFITVPKGLKAGSNGLLSRIVNNELTQRYEWKTRYPLAYYLLSFSVADYLDYSFKTALPGVNDSLLVQNFIYNHPSILLNEKTAIDKTNDLLILYSEILGTYPFHEEKYGHCLAPMGGGMEHQTMTTLSSFHFELVAHELAHQWFGNYVTCKTWQDIWINEGFATYLEYLAVEVFGTETEAANWMINTQNNAKRQPDGSIYIPLTEAHNQNRIFHGDLSYKKGAAILHMLRYEINDDDLFFKVLRDFLEEYAFSTATGDDFLNTLNRVTDNDYTWFFDQWYYGKGFPVFISSWNKEKDSITISTTQETSSAETTFFRTHLDYRIIYSDDTYDTHRVLFDQNNHRFAFTADKPVSEIIIDPDNKVLKTSVIQEEFPEELLFQISPNPFTKNLFIKFVTGIKSRRVTFNRLDGLKIFETSSISEYLYLDLSFLKEGIYIITINEDGKDYPMRIVKIN